MATESACLLIADISGYTGYLAGVELDHAQDILADLVGTIVSALRPGFRLAKLEGDAAFTYAVTDRIDGSLLLDTIERCYFGFRRRRRDMRQGTTCTCNACVRIPELNLKFVVHHGTILRQRVAGHEELLGADVIVTHRLLKNEVVATMGVEAYALFSQPCVDAMDVDVAALGMQAASETYEHIGSVPIWVHDLERRWQDEEARTRVFVEPRAAMKEGRLRHRGPAADRLGVRDRARPPRALADRGDGRRDGRNRQPPRGGRNDPLHARRGGEHRAAARLAAVRLLLASQHDPHAGGSGPPARDH